MAVASVPITVTHDDSVLDGLKSILYPFVSMPIIVTEEALLRSTTDMKCLNNLLTMFKYY